jgi:hypothetical protein
MPAAKRTRSHKRKTVPLTGHVTPQEKATVQRLAQAEGLSTSQIVRAFIQEGIRLELHKQHAVLLQPVIETTIRKEMAKIVNHIVRLLIRVAFDIGVVRGMTRNLLGRQPGVPDKLLNQIIDSSAKDSKDNIAHWTPQLQTALDELTRQYTGEERMAEVHG